MLCHLSSWCMNASLVSNSSVLHSCIILILQGWYCHDGSARRMNAALAVHYSSIMAVCMHHDKRHSTLKHYAALKELNNIASSRGQEIRHLLLEGLLWDILQKRTTNLFSQIQLALNMTRHISRNKMKMIVYNIFLKWSFRTVLLSKWKNIKEEGKVEIH